MLTVGSLFAGIGGFDLGLERAWMQVKWQVEIDPYCLKVLEKHWPHVRRYTDIKTVDWSGVEPVDLVCGGFPCQPVSVAGKRKGTADDRWLWPEFIRCVGVLRPRYVLIENVPGLLTANDGRAFAEVLRDMAACGYDAEWDCIPASAVGAHHRRDRFWLVANDGQQAVRTDNGKRTKRIFQNEGTLRLESDSSRTHVPNPDSEHCQEHERWDQFQEKGREVPFGRRDCDGGRTWSPEPSVGRVVDGVSTRMDKNRLHCLGNAVVPQVVEWIGRRIMEANKQ